MMAERSGYFQLSVHDNAENEIEKTYRWNSLNVFEKPRTSRFVRFRRKKIFVNANTKYILNNVYGEAHPGELMAILGSSGAGKTTLLNALTFNMSSKQTVSGIRIVGRKPLDAVMLSKSCGYVLQTDNFFGNITVREHLIFQAMVRLDNKIPYSRKLERVDGVIKEVGLSKCQHTIIGIPGRGIAISGGERKRLSFASETLIDPQFMFCDEPTSGLDSYSASTVIQVLKKMAQRGKTVVCTIHQPSSDLYRMFDKLLLVADGRVAFLGTIDEASEFFIENGYLCPPNHNPADFYIKTLSVLPSRELECKNKLNAICDAFYASDVGKKLHSNTIFNDKTIQNNMTEHVRYSGSYKVPWFTQFRAVMWRSWLNVFRDKMFARIKTLQSLALSLIVGIIYFGQKTDEPGVMNINGALYILVLEVTYRTLFGVMNVFMTDMSIFLRENRMGMYRTDVYFISKVLAELPIMGFTMLVYAIIVYFMVGFNPDLEVFLMALVFVVILSFVSAFFGYMASCIGKVPEISVLIGQTLALPLSVTGGFFMNVRSVPVYVEWFSKLSWFKYVYEILMVNQWYDVNNITCYTELCPHTGRDVLDKYSFSAYNFLPNTVCIFIIGFLFASVAYVALLVQTYKID